MSNLKITIETEYNAVTADCDDDFIPEAIVGMLICLGYHPETARELMLREPSCDSWVAKEFKV